MLIQKTVDIEVEVDIDDFSDEDIIDEAEARGLATSIPPLNSEKHHPLHDVYYALKYGSDADALVLMRNFLCDELGVVL